MCSSNCCFLTCIQVSQETGKMVWYYHLFKNFSVFLLMFCLSHIMLELILLLLWDVGVLVSHIWLFVTPMNYSPPGSSVHGILQARTPEWVSTPNPRDQTCISCIAGVWATRETLGVWDRDPVLLSSSTWITSSTRTIHFPPLIYDYMSWNGSGFHLCMNWLWYLCYIGQFPTLCKPLTLHTTALPDLR